MKLEPMLPNQAEIFYAVIQTVHRKHCKMRENTDGAIRIWCQYYVKIKRILLTDVFPENSLKCTNWTFSN